MTAKSSRLIIRHLVRARARSSCPPPALSTVGFRCWLVFVFRTADPSVRPSARSRGKDRARPLFLLVIFVHVLDTDSRPYAPGAFALIELF